MLAKDKNNCEPPMNSQPVLKYHPSQINLCLLSPNHHPRMYQDDVVNIEACPRKQPLSRKNSTLANNLVLNRTRAYYVELSQPTHSCAATALPDFLDEAGEVVQSVWKCNKKTGFRSFYTKNKVTWLCTDQKQQVL